MLQGGTPECFCCFLFPENELKFIDSMVLLLLFQIHKHVASIKILFMFGDKHVKYHKYYEILRKKV